MDNGEYINLFITSQVPQEFITHVLGTESFSDYALSIQSGVSAFIPDQNLEGS